MLIQLRRKALAPEEALPPPVVHPGRTLSVILKATDICNIACTFCSVGPAGKSVLSSEDFERLASELERIATAWDLREISVQFHGGEPTALGAEWIDRACVRLSRIPTRVTFLMQTNLISFPDRMIEVARRHRIGIGSSIDPLFGERVDVHGQDTYARWVENYRRLADAGFRIGAIFIVTRRAIGHARELYRACEALGQYTGEPFGLQVQPVYEQGRAIDAEDLLLTPEEFGQFLVDLHSEWERSGRTVRLTPIQGWADEIEGVVGRRGARPCAYGSGCATSHVGIDFNLDVAGCARRLDNAATIGNLRDGHLDDILLGAPEKRKFAVRTERLRDTECSGCRHFQLCYGGCPHDADRAYGSVLAKSNWCASYKMVFGAIEVETERRLAPGSTPATSVRTSAPEPPSVTVLASDRVADLLSPLEDPALPERWLLPTPDGEALAGDLGVLLRRRAAAIRIFVHDRHARLLRRFPKLLRHPSVRVVLFEGTDELSTALNLLNGLEANVALDLPSICRTEEGAAQASRALRRYLGDPLWKIQVSPFSEMLRAGIERSHVPWVDRWGLAPGSHRLVLAEGLAARLSGYAAEVVRAVGGEEAAGGAAWLTDHRACGTCTRRPLCGGRLAARAGFSCSSAELALAGEVAGAAEALSEDLRAAVLVTDAAATR